ncbi:MAG TPA: multidrug effflux MFS transporter [Opitutaceae bacterium]|nr:multidrug effflux MFS transporter [Opitutaceae bacterium]
MTSRPPKPFIPPHGLAALLAGLSAIGPFSIDAYLPSMEEIGNELHATPLAVQQTLTAYMIPFSLMTLWHGSISDTLGRRRVILWGMALFGLASAACACATNLEMLLVFRALQGMTAGAGMVVGRAIVRDLFHGADAQRVMSQVTISFAIAPAVAPVIGGWLHVWFGWRAVFVFLVLFTGTCWLLCQRMLPETLPPERRQPLHPVYLARSYWSVLTSLPFVAACLAVTLNFSGFFIYVVSAPVFLMEQLHVSATGFLWLFGPLTMGMASGAWLSGRLAGRMSPVRTMAWSYVIMGVATVANLVYHLLRPPALPWSVLPLFFLVLGAALCYPSMTLLALDLFPSKRGLAASCQSFAQTGGAAVNAMIAPLLWASARTLAVTQTVALALGLASLLVYLHVAPPVAAKEEGGRMN